jgi:hypothetical protein
VGVRMGRVALRLRMLMTSPTNLYPYPRRRLIRRTMQSLARLALRTLADFRVTGREHLPERGPLLVVANHFSTLRHRRARRRRALANGVSGRLPARRRRQFGQVDPAIVGLLCRAPWLCLTNGNARRFGDHAAGRRSRHLPRRRLVGTGTQTQHVPARPISPCTPALASCRSASTALSTSSQRCGRGSGQR